MNKVEAICRRTGYTFDLLKEKTKKEEIVVRRQIVMYYFLQKGWKYKEVAGLFGLDRATGNHSEKKVNEIRQTKYPGWAYQIYLDVMDPKSTSENTFMISKETIECVASM